MRSNFLTTDFRGGETRFWSGWCGHRLRHRHGRYEIEVIDLLANPRLAKDHQIVAIPTLVKKLPNPIRKIIGDLSDVERTLVGLDLRRQDA